ncbi:hypothetical protein N9Q51_02995 [Flavobacteriaceae bacterium]|nr:hypothetical protein [Flavobacteriaceae bacterium]|tara:strand:- start:240 stop:998 length:759 start_codon:yes stop_codon:yes gene_type:complete
MKKYISLIFLLFVSFNINAQAPQGFNYQATVRNSNGDLLMNQDVSFKFYILASPQTANPSYVEVQSVTTDELGQVALVIGQGDAESGVFSELDWSLESYYLSIELDAGNGYIAMGTTQFLSVPYALYAENSGNGLSNTNGLMNFNGWDNYQIWSDDTTYQLEPNSFLFIKANNTTLVFPDGPENCCFGDVIYIYVMPEEGQQRIITLQPSGFPVHTPYGWSFTDSYVGSLKAGLNTIINVGDFWMVPDFTIE